MLCWFTCLSPGFTNYNTFFVYLCRPRAIVPHQPVTPVLYFPDVYTDRADGGYFIFIIIKAYTGDPLPGHVPHMHSRSASVNKQLPRVITHLAVFILFY